MYLPFFVYGTLMPGQPNYYLWQNAILNSFEASLGGACLYDLGHYPMLVEEGDGVVRGTLLAVRPEYYRRVLTAVDRLEGFDPDRAGPFAYTRVARQVQVTSVGEVEAWVYIGDAGYLGRAKPIRSGSWSEHASGTFHSLVKWWRGVDTIAGHDELKI